MNTKKIWLSSPHLGGSEQKFVQEAFDTNWIAPLGSNVDGFEMDLESYLEKEIHVAVLSSGTAAIHLGLILLGVTKNDEVLVQTHTHNASVNPIIYQGATPIFIDSEIETGNICPVYLEKAIEFGFFSEANYPFLKLNTTGIFDPIKDRLPDLFKEIKK